MDIKACKSVLSLVLISIDAVEKAKADGKINLLDLPKLAPVIGALKDAIGAAKLVPEELKDLDATEISELFELLTQVVMRLLAVVFEAVPEA